MEFWQNVLAAFVEAVCRTSMARRSTHLAAKLISQTFHLLYEHYERSWKRSADEVVVDTDELDEKATDKLGVDFERIDARERQGNEINRLRRHLRSGLLSNDDFHLLIESRILGKSLQDCARALGITYQAAKKRRLRAESILRQFEANH